MHIIHQYDLERLLAYNRNERQDNRIKVELSGDIGIFSFPEVNYFNYIWVDETRLLTHNDLDFFISFYASQGINGHRILIPAMASDNTEFVRNDRNYDHAGKLVMTGYPRIKKIDLPNEQRIRLVPAGMNNLTIFTELYLLGFEAEDRVLDRVISNFRQLLSVKGMELFIVMYDSQPAGINILFRQGHDYFLAGGAVLPKFRNRQIHKISMAMRINRCLDDVHCGSIVSWAYDESISLQNMMKLGMTIFEERMIYAYTG